MILYVLDKEYGMIGDPIDTWTTAMWYRRYNEAGEMSLYLPASFAMKQKESLVRKNYVTNPAMPDHFCIIEALESTEDPEDGDILVITGRSLESILSRRVIGKPISVSNANFQDTIQQILNENVISPSDSERKIEGFIFTKSEDPAITELTISQEWKEGNVYDVIVAACNDKQVGFRVKPHGAGGFEFELYAGVDYSYAQDERPWVVFSQEYENLGKTTGIESDKAYKNVVLVRSDDSSVWVKGKSGPFTGLDRYETTLSGYGDAAAMKTKGEEELSKYEIEEVYSGEVDARRQYELGRDFQLGDIVQFVNKYGIEKQLRIIEVIHSHDKDGDLITPTFVNVPDKKT